jgi:ferredoxin, 2Fe-2S
MPRITYVEFSGTEHSAEVSDGENVMRGALYNGIPGIVGECGGACSCATCHVYIDPAWLERVGAPTDNAETELLDGASSPVSRESRLSCQIVMTSELDGLVVHMPERQY